jgi:16S rRNA (uracil1498-N3)-methyltransferase
MRRRFFVDSFSGTSAVLQGPSAYHLARVLRAEPGQLYELSDGKSVHLARIENVGREAIEFTLLEQIEAQANRFESVLLLALVKFDRFEWALEKATELGSTTIVPLAAMRSEKALIAAAPKRAARWHKILFESAQQARCLRPPQLRETVKSDAAFKNAEAHIRILLSERPNAPSLKSMLAMTLPTPSESVVSRVALAIGPEGGWTDEEVAAAEAAHFNEASLGANILRTETAVVAGLAALHLYLD